MKIKLLLILSLSASITTYADEFGTNLTLQAALHYGAENNAGLQSAYQRWRGVEEDIGVQKALPDPTLNYGYFFESVETKVGPQNQIIGLSQKIPGFGKLSLKESIATDAAAAIGEQVLQVKLNLQSQIASAYAELYYLKRSIDITKDSIQLVNELEQVTRTRYKTGDQMGPTLQAQVELGRLEDRLAGLQDQRQPRMARLNALLNRSPSASLPWPSTLPYNSIVDSLDAYRQQLPQSNPELTELNHRLQQSNHQVKLAKRERYPDFTLGVQYIQVGEASSPVADSGKDPIIGTIGITLPIWVGKNRSRIQSAAHQKTAVQYQIDNRSQTLNAELQQVLFSLRDADRRINLYKESLIPKANQSLEVNRKAYESGKAEFLNLIEAERMLLEFELSYERALSDHLINRAALSRLTGVDYISLSTGTNR